MVETPFTGPNAGGGGGTDTTDEEESTASESDSADASSNDVRRARRRFRDRLMREYDDTTDTESDTSDDGADVPAPDADDPSTAPSATGAPTAGDDAGATTSDSDTDGESVPAPDADDPSTAPSATGAPTAGDDAGATVEVETQPSNNTSTREPEPLDVQAPSRVPGENPESGAVTQAVGEYVETAEVDTEITDELTQGGLLSDRPETNEGLLPGSAYGVDLSREGFDRAANEFRSTAYEEFESNEEFTVAGSTLPDRAITGAAKTGVSLLNLPQYVSTADTLTEIAGNAPGVVAEEGPAAVAETSTGVAKTAASAIAEEATENPVEFAGGGVFGYLTGAKASQLVGKTARIGRDRLRTAGAEKVDLDDVTQEDVVKNVETDGAEGTRFPSADDPDLYQDDPAEAVARQADDMTPDAVDERFTEAGVDDGVVLKKALDTEPSGAGRDIRGTGTPTGFKTLEGDYESPGAFVGPELSPNFLRTDARGSMSLRPGLPDFGNKPTGVLAKTDVENVDADNLDKFNEELVDRAGDTTAYTKPASEVSTGEIEAVLPPGAEFSRLSSDGLGTRALRRFGIGSDFYTEVGGRRVPLRTVAPDSADADAGDIANAVESTSQTLDDYVVTPDTPQDNPVPLPPSVDGAGEADAAEGADAATTSSLDSAADTSSTPTNTGSPTGSSDSGLSGVGSLNDVGGMTSSTTTASSDSGVSSTTNAGSSTTGGAGSAGGSPFGDSGGTTGGSTRGGGSTGGSGTVPGGGGSGPGSDGPSGPPSSPGSPPPSQSGTSGTGSPFGGGGGGGDGSGRGPFDDGDSQPRQPKVDFSDNDGEKRRDRDNDDGFLEDLFDNPTLSPEEALEYDPLED